MSCLESGHINLNQQQIHAEVNASLTSILQMLFNLAASENDCCIPIFGIRGASRGGGVGHSNTSGDRDSKRSTAPSLVPSSGLTQQNLDDGHGEEASSQ